MSCENRGIDAVEIDRLRGRRKLRGINYLRPVWRADEYPLQPSGTTFRISGLFSIVITKLEDETMGRLLRLANAAVPLLATLLLLCAPAFAGALEAQKNIVSDQRLDGSAIGLPADHPFNKCWQVTLTEVAVPKPLRNMNQEAALALTWIISQGFAGKGDFYRPHEKSEQKFVCSEARGSKGALVEAGKIIPMRFERFSLQRRKVFSGSFETGDNQATEITIAIDENDKVGTLGLFVLPLGRGGRVDRANPIWAEGRRGTVIAFDP
jgi:hypothetical protein